MIFYNYIAERKQKVELEAIAKPQATWESPLAVFEAAFAHEQHINGRIDHKVDVANQLRMVGDDGRGILMLDRELGTRTYVAPTVP